MSILNLSNNKWGFYCNRYFWLSFSSTNIHGLIEDKPGIARKNWNERRACPSKTRTTGNPQQNENTAATQRRKWTETRARCDSDLLPSTLRVSEGLPLRWVGDWLRQWMLRAHVRGHVEIVDCARGHVEIVDCVRGYAHNKLSRCVGAEPGTAEQVTC